MPNKGIILTNCGLCTHACVVKEGVKRKENLRHQHSYSLKPCLPMLYFAVFVFCKKAFLTLTSTYLSIN